VNVCEDAEVHHTHCILDCIYYKPEDYWRLLEPTRDYWRQLEITRDYHSCVWTACAVALVYIECTWYEYVVWWVLVSTLGVTMESWSPVAHNNIITGSLLYSSPPVWHQQWRLSARVFLRCGWYWTVQMQRWLGIRSYPWEKVLGWVHVLFSVCRKTDLSNLAVWYKIMLFTIIVLYSRPLFIQTPHFLTAIVCLHWENPQCMPTVYRRQQFTSNWGKDICLYVRISITPGNFHSMAHVLSIIGLV